jgi:hypothetical protein
MRSIPLDAYSSALINAYIARFHSSEIVPTAAEYFTASDRIDERCAGNEAGPKNVDGRHECTLSREALQKQTAQDLRERGRQIRSEANGIYANAAIVCLHRQRGWGIAAAVLGAAMMAGCSSSYGLPDAALLKTQSVADSGSHDLFGRLSRQGGGSSE